MIFEITLHRNIIKYKSDFLIILNKQIHIVLWLDKLKEKNKKAQPIYDGLSGTRTVRHYKIKERRKKEKKKLQALDIYAIGSILIMQMVIDIPCPIKICNSTFYINHTNSNSKDGTEF